MVITYTHFIGIILLLLFIRGWIFYTKRKEMRKLINEIPGPPTLPILGNALDLLRDHEDYLAIFQCYVKKWPRIFRFWIVGNSYIFLNSHETIEPVLSSLAASDKADEYDHLHPWLGTGLLTSNGEKWKLRRKLLTPAFHFRILKDFLVVFNEQSDILIQQLNKHSGKEIDIFPFITNCTLDIICETAMGRHVNAQGNNASDYVKATDRIKDIIHSRHTLPWLWPDWLFNLTPTGKEHAWCLSILHTFTEKVINERKAEWTPTNTIENESNVYERKKRLAFLDLLLDVSDGGKVLNDNDIREEVDTFMFEGHDTTAAGISFATYLLGAFPEIQRKVHMELDTIFGSDKSRPVTEEDLTQMHYLECVIKEALRLCPSVPLFARRLKEEVVIDGYTIPTYATLLFIPYLLHRDPDVFPAPETFNPDRFLPENCCGRNPYAYIPFSAGPRNCVGQKFAIMEEKVVLSHIFRSYHISSLVAPERMRGSAELILKSISGFKLHLTPRNCSG